MTTTQATVAMTDTQRWLTLGTAVGAGLCAGTFFAFSTFVMPALRLSPPHTGLAAMQSINKLAPNPLFMTALFGPLATGGYLAVVLLRRPGRAGVYVLAGTACAAVGALVTIAYHVPHNDALARIAFDAPNAADRWRSYAGPWAAWNHVRSVAFTAATALFALALRE